MHPDRNRLLAEKAVGVERHAAGITLVCGSSAIAMPAIRPWSTASGRMPLMMRRLAEETARLRHVPGGPDVGNAGAHVFIDQHAAFGFDAAAGEKISHRRDAGGDQQQVRVDFRAVAQRGAAAFARGE